tara:strand:- start:3330 stop:4799 length:1470 start_codon:yes stop_codon:yes gene_type:complete
MTWPFDFAPAPFGRLSPVALAMCRVATGAVLLYEATLGMDPWTARAFLGDAGIWSRADQLGSSPRSMSILLVLADDAAVRLVMCALALLGGAIAVGWQTRRACALALVLWLSILERAWPFCHAFDDMTAALLLWGALGLPWDARHALSRRQAPETCIVELGFLLHIGAAYFLAGINKTSPEWRDGTAVGIAMQTVHIKRRLADRLCASPAAALALRLIGRTVRAVELATPLAFLAPPVVRAVAVASLLAMHASIGATMRLNGIGLTNVAAVIAFLPLGGEAARGRRRGVASDAMAIVVVALLLGGTVGKETWGEAALSRPMKMVATRLHLLQRYNVFSPRPPTQSWWVSMEGVTRQGDVVEALAALRSEALVPPFAPPPLDLARRPPDGFAVDVLHDDRFAKFMENMITGWGHIEDAEERKRKREQQELLRLRLGQFTCREWNGAYGGTPHELQTVDVKVFLQDNTDVCGRGERAGNVTSLTIWKHRCF